MHFLLCFINGIGTIGAMFEHNELHLPANFNIFF